ncbi:hypothetical protein [Extibacter muris]|uniref:Uncharacterized protein n=1 Tax=Extibacter muris TaxID=1796622 RepID=A0A4R4FEV5_9FIRM|nr:hypothetical protein [Extibacter muris]MCU0079336.1 hypothetical protein [Extibacter muris]TDA21941.1 hypothetical protein E1963_09275 [Extibacter muris]
MKYPCLVPKQLCKADIHVCIEQEGLTEDGGPIPAFEADLKCNYQDTAKTVLTAEGKQVQLSGVAMMPGDICPELPVISGGTVTIFGVERTIYQGNKARNPDGTVNYTELRLI